MKRAVVLLSGGLDSATVLAIAVCAGFECHALTAAYGQRHAAEIEAAGKVAAALGARSHRTIAIPLDLFGGSALTADMEVPKDRRTSEIEHGIPVTYVPARNTVLLSLALSYAETLEACEIFVGVNAVDYSGYPDCRPEFIEAFERLANLATKAGIEGRSFHVRAPLIDLSKADIIRKGMELGVDYALTLSCYDPTEDGQACGRCDACLIRSRAFAEVGVADPALDS